MGGDWHVVYDNPNTMCREAWVGDRMIAHISAALMYTRGFDGFPSLPFYLNVGREFVEGKVYGTIEDIHRFNITATLKRRGE